MNGSKKLVYDTLDMCNHSRAPRDLWTLPWAEERHGAALEAIKRDFPGDMATAPGFLREKGAAKGDAYKPGKYIDDWGCEFINIGSGTIGEVKSPQIKDEDWKDAAAVKFPVEWLSVDAEKVNAFCREHSDKFIMAGCCPRPFEQLQFLRGTAELYMDLMDPCSDMRAFINKMHAFYCELMEVWAKTDVDALNMMDDWGSQRSLLIPPRVWREVFRPMYRDYIDIAHRAGKKIFMHSDGYTLEIYPELIELGLDAFNSQIFCIGVEKLAKYKGKITFWGEIDRQHLLPHGSLRDIEDAVALVHENLWDNGGCIAQCEFGPGGNPDNVRRVYETWDRLTK
jgi:uroporphyrinogen decarboxylase